MCQGSVVFHRDPHFQLKTISVQLKTIQQALIFSGKSRIEERGLAIGIVKNVVGKAKLNTA